MEESVLAELRARSEDQDALSAWLYPLIEENHPALPEIAAWLGAQRMALPLLWLLDHYIVTCSQTVVRAVRAAISEAGLEGEVAALLHADLEQDAPEVRRAAALFAGLLRLEPLAPRLVAALQDPYFLTRMEAATALGLLGYAPAIPELRLSIRDVDILTRLAALEALLRLEDPGLLTVLTGQFHEDSSYTIGAFDDAEARVRLSAVRLLLRYRPPCAVPALEALLASEEDDPAVLTAAQDALERLRT